MSDTIQLRGGYTATSPLLGRLPEWDPMNEQYGARKLMTAQQAGTITSKTWWMPPRWHLNQGDPRGIKDYDPSACTGASRTYDLGMSPSPLRLPSGAHFDMPWAFRLYRLAQTLDEWAGEAYEGSSTLAAAKAARALGFIGEFHWALDIDEYLSALSHIGPVVNGTDWTNSMFDPHPSGLIIPDDSPSDVAGGHAWATRSIYTNEDYKKRLLGKGEPNRKGVPLLAGPQSWDLDWGRNGFWMAWADDMERLLKGIKYPGDAVITTAAFRR